MSPCTPINTSEWKAMENGKGFEMFNTLLMNINLVADAHVEIHFIHDHNLSLELFCTPR